MHQYSFFLVHGVYKKDDKYVSMPLVFAYLPGKSTQVYKELFDIISRHTREEPKFIITDFEMAAISALREVYPAAELRGCLFHLTKNIFGRIQDSPTVFRR